MGDVVHVRGKVGGYKGRAEIALDPEEGKVIERVSPGSYDARDFLPTIDKNPEHLFSGLSRKIRKMENRHLRGFA